MKHFLYTVSLILICLNLVGQSTKELKRSLASASDSTKVNILNKLGDNYVTANVDSSIYYYSQAVALAKKLNFHQGLVYGLRGNAYAQKSKGGNEKAAANFREILNYADSLNLQLENREKYLLSLAEITYEVSPIEATGLARKALSFYKAKGDNVGQLNTHIVLGAIYDYRKNYKVAIEQYTEAIKLSRTLSKNRLLGENLIKAAAIYYKQDNAVKALEYYYQAVDIGDDLNDKQLSAKAKRYVADVYSDQKKYQQATNLYLAVLRYYRSINDNKGQLDLNYHIGLSHQRKGDPKAALTYFFKAHEFAKKTGDKNMMAKNYIERGKSYLRLGNISVATKNANWALSIAKKEGYLEELMNSNLLLSDISNSTKKFGTALIFYKRYSAYKDRLHKEQKEMELLTMDVEYKNREREIEKAYLEKEIASNIKVAETQKKGEMAVEEKSNEVFQLTAKNDKLKNNTLIGSMILLLLFSLGTIIAYKNKLDDNKILINQKDEIINQKEDLLRKNKRLIELNEEKDSLVNMVAHDLRSPLDQIKGLVNVINMNSSGKNKNQEYMDMISYATERMRALIGRTLNIRNIDKQEIDPKNEVFDVSKTVDDIINNFVELANRKNLTIHSELQRNGCFIKADMNYMIQVLENLISNAIKFSPRGKGIRVKAGKYNRLVRIEVIDQGPGIRKEDMPKLFKKFQRLAARPTGNEDSTGLGLSIVKRFVDSMGGVVRCESTFGEGANFIVEFETYEPTEG